MKVTEETLERIAKDIASPVWDMVNRLDPDGYERWIKAIISRLRTAFDKHDRDQSNGEDK